MRSALILMIFAGAGDFDCCLAARNRSTRTITFDGGHVAVMREGNVDHVRITDARRT